MKSKTRTQNKYVNYTAEVVLKRVLKYVWKSKFMIICSLLFLIAYTFLELYQPKLINKMLDDHLLGVQTTWEKIDTAGVIYQGNNYQKVVIDKNTDISVVQPDFGIKIINRRGRAGGRNHHKNNGYGIKYPLALEFVFGKTIRGHRATRYAAERTTYYKNNAVGKHSDDGRFVDLYPEHLLPVLERE